MGRWRNDNGSKKKKPRTDGNGAAAGGGGGGTNKGKRGGVQGKNVDAKGWVITAEQHPQKREPNSPVFEAFYQAQGIVPPAEWKVFMKTLLEPLPASFRINRDCDFAELYVHTAVDPFSCQLSHLESD